MCNQIHWLSVEHIAWFTDHRISLYYLDATPLKVGIVSGLLNNKVSVIDELLLYFPPVHGDGNAYTLAVELEFSWGGEHEM